MNFIYNIIIFQIDVDIINNIFTTKMKLKLVVALVLLSWLSVEIVELHMLQLLKVGFQK